MLKPAKAAFALLVFSLPIMKPAVAVGGMAMTTADVLFVATAALFAGAVLNGEVRPRLDAMGMVLALYLAAILLPALAVGEFESAWPRLAAKAYLVALPLTAVHLVETERDLCRLFLFWLAASAVAALVGTAALIAFALAPEQSSFDFALHGFGTLPPGPYPRLQSLFSHPAMLCNYLTASLAILLLSRDRRWIGRGAFGVLLALHLLIAAFTLTPGLGGMALMLGLWAWRETRVRSPLLSRLALAGGLVAALAFLASATVTPFAHPGAPFAFIITGTAIPLFGSVRTMTWLSAASAFTDHPLFGAGLHKEVIALDYLAPSGVHHVLTDAHNVFLDIAMHSGGIGLLGVTALGLAVAAQVWRHGADRRGLTFCLGAAWLNAFVYQGLTGSYDDARHLWLLLGLFLAALRIEGGSAHR